jgi:1,2-dihydroxy-3-keto-5-methylthiopentene dioxygenase
MKAYYFDNIPGDQRLAHHSGREVSGETLKKININYWQIPLEGYLPKLNAVADERGYKNRDLINVSKAGLGDVSSGSCHCV